MIQQPHFGASKASQVPTRTPTSPTRDASHTARKSRLLGLGAPRVRIPRAGASHRAMPGRSPRKWGSDGAAGIFSISIKPHFALQRAGGTPWTWKPPRPRLLPVLPLPNPAPFPLGPRFPRLCNGLKPPHLAFPPLHPRKAKPKGS